MSIFNRKKKKEKDFDDQMFADIRELCVCCVNAVVVIAKRYNEDPLMVSNLFLDVYKSIDEEAQSRS